MPFSRMITCARPMRRNPLLGADRRGHRRASSVIVASSFSAVEPPTPIVMSVFPGDDRQDQAGAQIAGVEHRLMGDAQFRVGPIVAAGVVIAVEIRKVGARHGEADPLTGLEQDAGGLSRVVTLRSSQPDWILFKAGQRIRLSVSSSFSAVEPPTPIVISIAPRHVCLGMTGRIRQERRSPAWKIV